MKKSTKSLEKKVVREIFNEFDSDVVCVEDLDLKVSGGSFSTIITHITNGSTDSEFTIGLWSGDPEEDDNAEEMCVPEEKRVAMYKEILEEMA